MAIDHIEVHIAEGLSRLLSQYQQQPNIEALFTAFLEQVQVLEDGLFGLVEGRMLFGGGAVGVQLDQIGSLAGADRNGLSDADYLLLIKGKVAQNNGNCTLQDLRAIVQDVYAAQAVTVNTPFSPGHAHIEAPAVVGLEIGLPREGSTQSQICLTIVKESIPAGVTLSWMSYHSGADAFAFDGPGSGSGFGDLNDASTGGTFADLFFSNAIA